MPREGESVVCHEKQRKRKEGEGEEERRKKKSKGKSKRKGRKEKGEKGRRPGYHSLQPQKADKTTLSLRKQGPLTGISCRSAQSLGGKAGNWKMTRRDRSSRHVLGVRTSNSQAKERRSGGGVFRLMK